MHGLKACKKSLRKAKKKKTKQWKLPTFKGKSRIKIGERLSSLGREKKFQLRKDIENAKSQHQKKSSFMSFGVYDKASNVFKKIILVIHRRKSWICIMTYAKSILIFKINKDICHFLYNDNKRKRVDEQLMLILGL